MKKLFSIIGGGVVTTTAAATVVSCDDILFVDAGGSISKSYILNLGDIEYSFENTDNGSNSYVNKLNSQTNGILNKFKELNQTKQDEAFNVLYELVYKAMMTQVIEWHKNFTQTMDEKMWEVAVTYDTVGNTKFEVKETDIASKYFDPQNFVLSYNLILV